MKKHTTSTAIPTYALKAEALGMSRLMLKSAKRAWLT